MSTTSVSLKNLHFLLQHMDASKRFEISRRCPALREFEKSVPLKINCLVLRGNSVMVNNTTYEIGIIRKCKVGETPRHVAKSNERGGDPYEVDAYGIRDELDTMTVTPGDVVINQSQRLIENDDELYIRLLEEDIQHFEGQLAALRGKRPSRQNLENINRIEQVIEDSRARLLEYQCRRDNIPSCYEFFFQLTKTRIVDKQKQKTVERYKRNKKFSEAMKQLTTVLFGGRCSPIYVRELQCLRSRIIRLPVGFTLQIEQLMFSASFGTSVGVLAPILNESSFPLKKLDIEAWSDEDATNPIVQTAEILRIRFVYNYLQIMSAITNPVVHLTIALVEPEQTELFEDVAKHWIQLKRPVGFEYIFDFYDEPRFVTETEDMLKRLNGVPVDDENVIIQMSAVTQIKVSYGPFPEFAPRSKWAVRFLTEAVEP